MESEQMYGAKRDVPLPYAPTLIDALLSSVKRVIDVVKEDLYK